MERKYDHIIMIVVDGLGVGSAPDAAKFADQGADTLGSLVRHFRARLQLPVLTSLGLGEVHPLFAAPPTGPAHAYYGQAQPAAVGKTALEGVWELLGAPTQEELTAFPQGFSPALVSKIRRFAHRPVIGNRPARPQSVLARWGAEQLATGGVIVFTSGGADLWLTAHEATMTDKELYQLGQAVRRYFDQQAAVKLGRVVTVPFAGTAGDGYYFQRSAARVWPLAAPAPTILHHLRVAGIPVRALNSRGDDGKTLQELRDRLTAGRPGLWLAHLTGLDRAGHQRDPERMGRQLRAVDQALGDLLPALGDQDLLLLTATHGNDPDFPGVAITREWVPVLAYSPCLTGGRLADRSTLADQAALILENFGLSGGSAGKSFLNLLK